MDKERTSPYFISGYEVEKASHGQLQQIMTAVNEDGDELDLISLKELIRASYSLQNFAAREIEWQSIITNRQTEIQKKFFVIFTKFCAISIDGYKRDRYMLKIQDMTEKVEHA